eukprot:scaffold18470_cov29-Tisochrysis_lutea.AAC.2
MGTRGRRQPVASLNAAYLSNCRCSAYFHGTLGREVGALGHVIKHVTSGGEHVRTFLSSRHDWTLHHEVDDVRTGVTPSPASERSKLCPPTRIKCSTSCMVRNLSNARIQGSRWRTRGAYCDARVPHVQR